MKLNCKGVNNMIKEPLYTIAIDENGKSIQIDKAEKGIKYLCPECNNEFILRKSGKTGRGSRRAHFAHNQLTTNCTPESYLHSSFKLMLLEIMKDYIQKGLPLGVIWKCNYCGKEHGANILNGVLDVKDEYDMKICRPDIALFDARGNVPAVIEVVVTHEPEEAVKYYYKKNNIVLIKIVLDSLKDLENIENKVKTSSDVNICLTLLNQDVKPYVTTAEFIAEYVNKNNEYFKRREQRRKSLKRL